MIFIQNRFGMAQVLADLGLRHGKLTMVSMKLRTTVASADMATSS